MADLNRRNQFARKGERTGKFFSIDYNEAWTRLKASEQVYEKVMPDHGVTRSEKARIPWTLVDTGENT